MKRIIGLFILLMILQTALPLDSQAAPAYAFRVKFKDKNGTLSFADSLSFLSPKAMQRRNKQGIMLDSSDLPVVQWYIDTAMQAANAVKLHNVSKWFNQIVLITFDSSKVTQLSALPMVASVKLVARYPNGNFKTETSFNKTPEVSPVQNKTAGNSAHYGLSFQQIDLIQSDCLHDLGFLGEGIDIAVFDVNFRYTNTCAAFDSLNADGRIKDTKNFVKDTSFVYSVSIPNDHGMNVLSCMAANQPSVYVGSAPKANYFLYITEDISTEQLIEEDNWLSAAERSDSIGVDMINSSLGYNIFDQPHTPYTYANMDGNTSLIVKAANKAVSKGIFVVQAQGNEGAGAWIYMLTPADGDSVYSVGSVDGSGAWGQSGYGPTYHGVIKPDGVCVGKGVVLIGGNCQTGTTNGSSFASPTMCGAIACLWQAHPEMTVWELRDLLRKSSSLYANPNNTLGYGIPDFCKAHQIVLGNIDYTKTENSFVVFPNPINDNFFIRNVTDNAPFQYQVFDASGRRVFQSELIKSWQVESESLKALGSGTYTMMIVTGSKVQTIQLQKL